jgi:hypothetical protein
MVLKPSSKQSTTGALLGRKSVGKLAMDNAARHSSGPRDMCAGTTGRHVRAGLLAREQGKPMLQLPPCR